MQATQSQPDFIPADPDFIPAEEQKPQPQPGPIRRFATRALGVPEDVFEHPNKWINPFSKEYWNPAQRQQATEAFAPPTRMSVPGSQTLHDIKQGNYAGALGDVLPPAMQLAGMTSLGRTRIPVEAPSVYEGPAPAEIPAGRPTGTRDLSAVPSLLKREVTGKVPFLSRFESTKKPTFSEWHEALTARNQPTEVPVQGNVANAEIRGPYEPLKADLSVQPSEPAPRNAPVRGESQNVQTFRESTPAEIEANTSRLAANRASRTKVAPVEAPVNGPKEVPVTGNQNLGLPRTTPGEGVLNQVLTALDNKTLLKVARSRGINVSQEANLKPGVADTRIIRKIIDDFSPEELEEARNQGIEMSRHTPVQTKGVSPEAGKEAWHYKVLNTFFPDVAVPKTMASRAQATIANRGETQAPPVTAVPPPKAILPTEKAPITINPENLRTILKRGNIPEGQIPRVLGREGSYLLEEGDLANHPRIPEPGEDLSEILQQSINKVKAQKSRAAKASQ